MAVSDTVTMKLDVDIKCDHLQTAELGSVETEDFLEWVKLFGLAEGSGDGSGASDRLWHDKRTLAASATEHLDVETGLVGPFGAVLRFGRIGLIVIFADEANTNDVIMQRRTTTGVHILETDGDEVIVPPGGLFMAYAGGSNIEFKAADESGDVDLTVRNSAGGTSVTYDIIIVGVD